MRIAVLGGVQHESLTIALRAMLPSADVLGFDVQRLAGDPALRERTAILLASFDHVLSQDVAAGNGPLTSAILQQNARGLHLIPTVAFAGFHPDTVGVQMDELQVPGPTGVLHSRIAVMGYLAGLPPEESAALFNRLVFSRLGYFGAIRRESARLGATFGAYGLDFGDAVGRLLAGGCFMHSPGHPHMALFVEMARAACAMMGLAPGHLPAAPLPDPLAAMATHPFMVDLAMRAGLAPDGAFRAALPASPMSLPDFVTASYKALQRVPLACLRAVPGVAEALERLDLKPAVRISKRAVGDTALITWHGTIVRADTASGLLVQERLWPETQDCTDFSMTPRTGEDGNRTADTMGGVDVVAAAHAGSISIRRNERYLSAEPRRYAVLLNRKEAHIWESFLPLSLTDVAVLRSILSHHWSVVGEDKVITAQTIRIREAFVMEFGAFSVNLSKNFPVPAPQEQDAASGFVLQTPQGPRTIRQSGAPAADQTALVPWRGEALQEAPSLPAFRTMREATWSIAAPDEILHAPLTATDADAAWIFQKYYIAHETPPLGVRQGRAKMQRMQDKFVLLSRKLEGIVFGRDGVVKDHGFLNFEKKVTLPAGVDGSNGAILVDDALLRTAEHVEGPVVVFYNPNLQNYFDWLLEAAVPLRLMAPYLPAGTRLLLPGTLAEMQAGEAPLDHLGVLRAMGLGDLPVIEMGGTVCRAGDVIWLDSSAIASMPAALLQRVRAEVTALHPAPEGPPVRIYVRRTHNRNVAANPVVENFLAAHRFQTVVLEEMTPEAQIRLFMNAEMVVSPHGAGLSNLLFCPAGTRVLEIAPQAEFRPFFWQLADKLGLPYGVLPCPTLRGGFNGELQVDLERLRALFRMLRFVSLSGDAKRVAPRQRRGSS